MALSMPLNGLKEEDKEPLIELFVKVSTHRPERRGLVFPAPQAPPRGVPAGRGGAVPPAPLLIVSAPRLPASQRDLGGPCGRGDREATPQGGTRLSRAAWVLSPSSSCPTPPRREPQPRAAPLIAHPTHLNAGAWPV